MRKVLILLTILLISGCTFTVRINGHPYYVEVPGAVDVTPTEEILPTPFPTATPIYYGCTGKIGAGWNLRDGPYGNIVGSSSVVAGQVVKFEAVRIASQDFTWWYAFWFNESTYAWIINTGITFIDVNDCPDLPMIPPGTTAWGVWVGPGADVNELITFGRDMKAEGLVPSATVYGNISAAEVLFNEGWITAVRPFIGDCSLWSFPARDNAIEWVNRAVENLAGINYSWLSISNECSWPDVQYAHDWIKSAIEEARNLGVNRVIPVVWNSGSPELSWMPVLADAYRVSGIEVCFGLNIYPVYKNIDLSDKNPDTIWTTYRYELLRVYIPDIPICVTEFAAGDGTQLPNFTDDKKFVSYSEGDFLFATKWYDALPLSAWLNADIRGRLWQLIEAYK